jgi:DNA repair protein RadC
MIAGALSAMAMKRSPGHRLLTALGNGVPRLPEISLVYLKTGTRFTAPQQVYETFKFLMQETKEMFILKEAGEIMGIKVLDHIIVGEGEYLSFVERGLL